MTAMYFAVVLGLLRSVASMADMPPPALRIMPFGDSITEWECELAAYVNENDKPVAPGTPGAFVVAPGGYRGYLATMLLNAAVSFDFVGSRFRCGNHEGYSGQTIEFLASVAANALGRHRPDVVLFMGGTNDFYFEPPTGANWTTGLLRMRTLLDTSFGVLNSTTFLISTVTKINEARCANYPKAPWHPGPCPATMTSNIDAFNAALPALVADYRSKGYDVRLHDVNAMAAFEENDYWIWGIHFNASGFEKMASAWNEALKPVIVEHQSPQARIV